MTAYPVTEEEAWRWLLAQRADPGCCPLPGPLAPAAHDLLELYGPIIEAESITVAQLGQSLDGRIATQSGHSQYVTGPEDIEHLHRLRALVDGVVVGAGTVVADDPRLTVRKAEGVHPVRVILDPDGRIRSSARVFQDGEVKTLVVHAEGHGPCDMPGHVECMEMPVDADGRFAPPELRDRLAAEHGLHRLLVEGGGRTVSRFLASDTLDRLHLTIAPMLIGSGRQGITLPEIDTLDQALRPPCRIFRLGGDTLYDLDLRSKP
ncbi:MULTISPECIES: RibD family protein [unclassified Thioalkalivibrio]|uniref:RibD family protein n=1 Tax=unclassified Thioalkalivibrio TaxID=2621013 RepID=UPI0003672754|nr:MULTISPECIES: RibD family protein [unclassified Thioalkalivibrio]